ncbi:MAG: GNAT family N-acetyltransferase [bacterium]
MNIQIEMIDEQYINDAVNIALDDYRDEINRLSILPVVEDDFIFQFRKIIGELFTTGSGLVAIYNKQIVGYLSAYLIDELFGQCKGVYCPLIGHGAIKKNRREIYQKLYKTAADIWVKKGYTSHAITLYAGDKKTINTWFWLGFGLRCVDAIREVALITGINSNIVVKKAEIADILVLSKVHRKHNLYYRKSPMFMPAQEENPIKDLQNWMAKENHHLWIALDGEELIGYMRIEPQGESFVSKHQDVMNITGAFVDEDYRGSSVGTKLLTAIQEWLMKNDYKLCGVDFESFNCIGSSFWNKYFKPYTYTVVRRIDERIIPLLPR